MLAGHYSASFVAKAVRPDTPLWVLLLAAQLVDVLWALFVLAGIEHLRLDPSLPSNPLVLYDMPWTHSLLGSLLWGALAAAAAKRWLRVDGVGAALVGAVVVSHWFLDLLVHRPDLSLAGGPPMLGLSLWDHPAAAFLLEEVLVLGTAAMAMQACAAEGEARRRWLWLAGGLALVQAAQSFGPVPPGTSSVAVGALLLFGAVSFAGSRVDAARAGGPRVSD